MSGEREGGGFKPELVLPENPQVREKLGRKLKEYEERLKTRVAENAGNRYMPPERMEEEICGTVYKIAIVTELLNHGRVDTYKLSRRLASERKLFFSVARFNNACGVIKDYMETGGQGNIRGSF